MEKLFDNKRTYISNDGDEYIALSIPTHDLSKLRNNGVLKLTQYEQGRIDRFAYNNVTKNMDAIDLVMYSNHIYNPFAIKEGELLYLPVDDDIYSESVEPTLPDGSTVSSNKSPEKKRTYAEEVEYIARMGLGVK